MIVVDTSVWIGHMRNANSEGVRKLRNLENPDEILVGDIILMELLQGARDKTHATRIGNAMQAYAALPMLGITNAQLAAANYRRLREEGITIRKSSDLIIGSFCIANNPRLLHEDRDFEPMQRHLGLSVI